MARRVASYDGLQPAPASASGVGPSAASGFDSLAGELDYAWTEDDGDEYDLDFDASA